MPTRSSEQHVLREGRWVRIIFPPLSPGWFRAAQRQTTWELRRYSDEKSRGRKVQLLRKEAVERAVAGARTRLPCRLLSGKRTRNAGVPDGVLSLGLGLRVKGTPMLHSRVRLFSLHRRPGAISNSVGQEVYWPGGVREASGLLCLPKRRESTWPENGSGKASNGFTERSLRYWPGKG